MYESFIHKGAVFVWLYRQGGSVYKGEGVEKGSLWLPGDDLR